MADDTAASAPPPTTEEPAKPNPWANVTLLQPDTLRHQYLIPPQSIDYHEANASTRTPAWERHCYDQFALDSPSDITASLKVPNNAAMQNVRHQIESLCKDVNWLQYMVWQALLEECYEAWASTSTAPDVPRVAASSILQRIHNGIHFCMNGHRPSRGLMSSGEGSAVRREVLSGGRVADWLAGQTEPVQDTTNPYVWATPGAMREFLLRKEGRPTVTDVQAQLHELAEHPRLDTTEEYTLTSMDRAMLAQLLQVEEDASKSPVDYQILVCDRNTFQLALVTTPDPQREAAAAKWATQRSSQISNACWTEPPSHHWLVQAKATLPGPVAATVAAADIPAELVPTRRGRGRTIYYGNTTDSSGTSPKQLQEAVVRWITEQEGPASLSQCIAQLEVPPARMRTALGKLVWQRRQLVEKTVVIEEPAAVAAVVEPNDATNDEVTKYAQSVYATEQALRRLIVRQLTTLSPHKLALAGDDAMATEEDYTGAEWHTTGHEWINLAIMRPVIVEDESILMRYEITAYTPARFSEDDGVSMERRPRFRAVPAEGPALLLTEAQVWAGRHALLANEQQPAASSRTLVQSMRLQPTNASGGNVEAQVIGHDSTADPGEQKFLLLLNGESNATWATLRGSQCVLDRDGTEYQVRLSDYDADSAAYQECVTILKYIQRQPKGKPFLYPVDPIALGIPQYAEVVKQPMDVSTVFSKLERGAYSNPPSVDNNPVISMLQGPFRADIELMFDNAMLFNPPDDWIHHAAAGLKQSALSKIEQSCRNHSTTDDNGRSMYVDDEFSDDEGGGSRKRKRRGGASSSRSEDVSAAAIAEPVRLDVLQSRLPMACKVEQFSWDASRWQCRTKSQSELDALKALYQLQKQEQRSRSRRKAEDSTISASSRDLEYYTTTSLTATNRLQAELQQEDYHERMAQQYASENDSTKIPVYPGCLPPYFGRVLDGKWEIRSERVGDALRWVVRGLAHTEHVVWDAETEFVTPNSLYHTPPANCPPFGSLDARKAKKAAAAAAESEEEEEELSEYEKARLERVARNNEKLRLLGLT